MQAHPAANGPRRKTPVEVMVYGAAAGLGATLLLSALSRVLPGLWNERGEEDGKPASAPPEDPFDHQQVRDWQEHAQSPAAHSGNHGEGGPPAVEPAGALSQPVGPGPEGLAEQFAFKVASGVFNKDISPYMYPVGIATHLAYGSAWGALYGLLQASYRLPPPLFGACYGAAVYGAGPAFLVPAMKLMGKPTEEPPQRTWMLLAGHVIYGITLAQLYDALEEKVA